MEEIVERVQRVTQLIAEISSATHEQSSGIGQVGDAISQLDQVTQQNAALVEESAAAAESLRHQANQLAKAVSVFKVDQGAEAREHAAASSAQPRPGATHADVRRPGRSSRPGESGKSRQDAGKAHPHSAPAAAAAAAPESDAWTSF